MKQIKDFELLLNLKRMYPYGYADEIDILNHGEYPIGIVGDMLRVGRTTLFKGLRDLGILRHNKAGDNLPSYELEENIYFVVTRNRKGNNEHILTTKATKTGASLISYLVDHNPNLFPKKSDKNPRISSEIIFLE